MAKSEKPLTDLEKIEVAKAKAQKAKQMQARHLQTAAKIQKRITDKARSEDTRRKIIVGSIVMSDALIGDGSVAKYLLKRLEQQVEERDRLVLADFVQELRVKLGGKPNG